MSPNVKVEEAARVLGKSAQFVRIALQQKILPIGVAVQITPGRWNYHISRHLLEQYLGGNFNGTGTKEIRNN